jgi:hypothetical protein
MIKKAYFIIVILIIMGCSKKISSSQIFGSWWSIEVDSTYSESYINNYEWVYNHQSFGPIHYKYYFLKDTLIIFKNMDSMGRKWIMLNSSDSKLVLQSDSVVMELNKLRIKRNYFDTINDSVKFDIFQHEFICRYLRNL